MRELSNDECHELFLNNSLGLYDTIRLIYKEGYDERSEELDANIDGTESDVESGSTEDSPIEETVKTTTMEKLNEKEVSGLLHVDSATISGDVVCEEVEGGGDNREGSEDHIDELEWDTTGLGQQL